ncbi:MAG: ATP-binding protein, partial [Gammaproteobacteria bacterium]|nr:ATP-binding protein [Gammaproteobacteria bacterium]
QQQAVGGSVDKLETPWRELLAGFIASDEFMISKIKLSIEGQTRVLNLFKAMVSTDKEVTGGIAILIEDHSERYSLEEKLAHSERLASIGQLAAGVAHEIGNPVTGIACLAQDLRSDLETTPGASEGLNKILTQTDRISRIVGSLSNYSHVGAPDEYPAQRVYLYRIVDEAIELVSLSRAGKQMQYDNNCDTAIVLSGFAQKLIQVFVNLLANSTDASEPGQVITIESTASGNQVLISVRDYGKGISEADLPRIFEPFFTTKTVGEGTGLGLSLTYNIIQEHGGSISVSSEVGRGCRFDIILPVNTATMVAQA